MPNATLRTLDAGQMPDIRVWVMPPTPIGPLTDPVQYSFAWSWGSWIEHKRLIVKAHRKLPGAMGSAEFTMIRSNFDDNKINSKNPIFWDDSKLPIIPGCYVCVTAGPIQTVYPNAVLNVASVLWFGFIDSVEGDQLAGTTEQIGMATALEVGHLMDRVQARGWKRALPTQNGQAYAGISPISMTAPDSANIGGHIDGQVIGNAVYGSNGNGENTWLFQGDPSHCFPSPWLDGSTTVLFTRWKLLKHFQRFCLRDSFLFAGVTWDISCLDGSEVAAPDDPNFLLSNIAGYLNGPNINGVRIPEVFKLRNQTCKGMLDLLIPRPFGLGWTIVLGLDSQTPPQPKWKIVIYTLSDTTTYGLPSFNSYSQLIDLSILPVTNFHRRSSGADAPDEIIVEGSQIIFGVTGGNLDGNIDQGWTPAQEALYRQAASIDTAYAARTVAQKLELNRAIRQSPGLTDVYTRYSIKPLTVGAFAGDISRFKTNPGAYNGSLVPICPSVVISSVNQSISFEVDANNSQISRSPYLPTSTLSRTLPWIDGSKFDGTDLRPASLRAWPAFSQPRLFYYDSTKSAGGQWIDLISSGGTRPAPGYGVDDRGAALRLTYHMPERLGFNFINLSAPAGEGIYDAGTIVNPIEGTDLFDWRRLVFTFGIASDQRVSYTIRRPGLQPKHVRMSLKIVDEKYNLWIMHGGSVLSIGADGNPVRVAGTGPDNSVVVRNDFPALYAHAQRVASFAFRRRRGFTYTGMRPDAPPAFASIGSAINKITEGNTTPEIFNTVIERVECQYGNKPRVIIEADLPPAPGMSALTAPSSGGPIAVTLNGTVSQAVQQVQGEVKALQADGQRVPIIAPYSPGGLSAPSYLYTVIGGSVIPTLGVVGIPRSTTAIDPNTLPNGPAGTGIVIVPAFPVPTGLPAGIGVVGRFDVSGSPAQYYFCRVDGTYAGSYGSDDLIVGESAFLATSSFLDKVSGPTTWRYVCLSGITGYA